MPFLDSDTCAEGGYLFLPGFSSLYDAIHGWMTGRMDEKNLTTTTSVTICDSDVNVLAFISNLGPNKKPKMLKVGPKFFGP
jgi:hypothetical protein